MRFTRSVAGLLAALMAGCLLACGPSKQAACMQICGGCCDPFGLCVGGLAAEACGAGGAVCQACSTGSTCSAGTCVALAADGGADAGRDAGSTDAGLADAGPDAGADAGSDAGACGNFGSLCAADSSFCLRINWMLTVEAISCTIFASSSPRFRLRNDKAREP